MKRLRAVVLATIFVSSPLCGQAASRGQMMGGPSPLTVVHPPADAHVGRGPLLFLVNVPPDPPASSMSFRMEGPLNRMGPVEMEHATDWGWRFIWDAREAETGPYLLRVTATGADGATLGEAALLFMLEDLPVPSPDPRSAWPLAGANAGRTGVSVDAAAPPFILAWAMPLDGRPGCGSPVLRDGILYIGTCGLHDARGGTVLAIEGATGAELWREKTPGAILHAVCVDEASAYAFTDKGRIFAFDVWNGERRWNSVVIEDPRSPASCAPLLSRNLVYAGQAGSLVALDAASGRTIWRARPFASHAGGGPGTLPHHGAPALGESGVFIACPTGLAALDGDTGALRWSSEGPSGNAACRRGVVYLVEGGSEPRVTARREDEGRALWQAPLTDAGRGLPDGAPVVTDDAVIVAGRTALHCFDRVSGEPRWSRALLDSAAAGREWLPAPVVSGTNVLAVTTAGLLEALDLAAGESRWTLDLGVPVHGSPAVSGNTLYLAADDGMLYAFVSAAP